MNQPLKANTKMKESFKNQLLIITQSLCILLLIGCGQPKRWQADNKELFCDKEFKNTTYLDNIAMEVKRTTLLNSNGTYESRQGWSADKSHEQDYRNTVGKSGDEDYSFTGTWEIIKPTTSLTGDGSLEKFKPTYIKFKSSTGQSGYACITCNDNFMALQPIDASGTWIVDEGEINVGMFAGSMPTSIENAE